MSRFLIGKGIAACVIVTTLLAGCGQVARDIGGPSKQSRVVTDDLGRMIAVPIVITRAVSTAPSITESIFAVGAGDRLVGVTTFCTSPEEAKSIPKIGDTMAPNVETIVALRPEVVLVSTASQIQAFTETLEQNGIAVYVTNPRSLDEVFENLIEFGRLFGTENQADVLVANLRRRVEAVRIMEKSEPRQRVFVQVSKEPLFTVGSESFVTAMLEAAGVVSATAHIPTAYPKLSPEAAAALDPDAIILSDSEDNRAPNEAFRNSTAVKSGRVYRIDAEIIARPGPRVVDALEQIARALHVHRS